MRYVGAVLVKPENSLHSYDIAQNAVMHYDTSKHYKTICFQNGAGRMLRQNMKIGFEI